MKKQQLTSTSRKHQAGSRKTKRAAKKGLVPPKQYRKERNG